MRRGLLITGLILLVIFGAVTWISYADAVNNCATDIFGNEANPSGCSADAGGLGLGIIVVIVALILVILGAVLRSKDKAAPAPPAGRSPGMPAGKVCLRCGTYFPEPVPAFCGKCGGPVGASFPGSAQAPPGTPGR